MVWPAICTDEPKNFGVGTELLADLSNDGVVRRLLGFNCATDEPPALRRQVTAQQYATLIIENHRARPREQQKIVADLCAKPMYVVG